MNKSSGFFCFKQNPEEKPGLRVPPGDFTFCRNAEKSIFVHQVPRSIQCRFFDRTSKCLSTKYAAFFEKWIRLRTRLRRDKGGAGEAIYRSRRFGFFLREKSFSPPPGSHHPFSEAARGQSSSLFSRSGFSGGSISGVSMARRSSMNSSASERPFCKKKSISFSLNCSISSCNFSAGFIQSA